MSFAIADRVKETTATTGAGTINLAGAATQFQSFISAVGTGNQCTYCLLSGNGTDWETGIGTVTSGTPNTLSRTTVLASSNSGSLISLTGTSTVFLTEPAAALKNRLAAPVAAPPVAASWTHQNFGGSTTLTDVANGVLLFDSASGATNIIRGFTVSSPSTPYTIDLNITGIGLPLSGDLFIVGVGWTDGTKLEVLFNQQEGSVFVSNQQIQTYSNYTTYVSTVLEFYAIYDMKDMWFRLADNGTNVTWSMSADGVSWLQFYTVAKSSGYLGSSGYSNIGVFFNSGNLGNGASGNVTLRSWWQH